MRAIIYTQKIHTRARIHNTHPYTHGIHTRNTHIFSSFFLHEKRNYYYEQRLKPIQFHRVQVSTLEIPHGNDLYVYSRQWKCVQFARDTFCRISARKIELAGITSVPFSDNKEEKSGNVSRTERQNGSSDDIVRSVSTTSRNKENGRIPLSCDSLCLNVFRSHVLSSLFPVPSPLAVRTLHVLDSFFLREPILLIRYPLFCPRASSLSPYVFSSFFFTRIIIQASAFIAYSILACKIIYIYIRLNLVLKSKFIVPPRTLPISNMAHFTYCILI